MTLNRGRAAAALACVVVGASLSFVLLLAHDGVRTGAADALCGAAAESGCDRVNQSAYSEVAGVPLAGLGLAAYLALATLLGLGLLGGDEARAAAGRLAFYALAAGLLFDVALLGVQAFAIKAYCSLCIGTYVANALALAALLPARRGAPLLPLLGAPRLVAGAGLLTGVAVLSVVVAAHLAFRAQAGSPALLTGGAPARAPGDGSAQAEVKRLQAILDDPRKYEEYSSQKAMKEFEQAAPKALDLTKAPYKGADDAPIKVTEFADFLCPACANMARAFAGYLPQTGNRVALYFKHYPLDTSCNTSISQMVHPGACLLARAAICAQEQGRFWQYHDRVFAGIGHEPKREDVVKAAEAAGIDARALDACLGKPATQERLAADIREAAASGVQATPTFFINGRRVSRMSDFPQMVEREAARLGLPPLPQPERR
jgi:protein-disulfide isomerase/uncharacterized membrane protein